MSLAAIQARHVKALAEAAHKAETLRESAYVISSFLVAGVEIRELTLSDVALLSAINSPYINGGSVTQDDMVLFMWVLSPQYARFRAKSGQAGWRERLSQQWFAAKLCWVESEEIGRDIDEYLEVIYLDSPAGDGGESKGSTQFSTVSYQASYVNILATEYSWSEEHILSMPLRRVFQYTNLICNKHDPDGISFNRLVDLERKRYLQERRLWRQQNAKLNHS